MTVDNRNKLDASQAAILSDFITEFLPTTGTKRKYTANEIYYIHETLNRIFMQQFGFKIPFEELKKTFENLGYTIFELKGKLDNESKVLRPSKNGELNVIRSIDKAFVKGFLFIDVKADTVRYLRKTTATLQPNTNPDKFDKTKVLMEKIENFKKSKLAPQL